MCEPPEQSLAELCEALRISKGAASTNSRLLEAHGLLQRVPRATSRQVYYRIPPGAYETLMERKLRATRDWRRAAAEGQELADELGADAPERLKELHRFYDFMEKEQERILERWRAMEAREEG